MKKIIYIILLSTYCFISAQEFPLNYTDDVPNGAYYKDLNGELNKYVGLWKGDWNGKTVYLELKKMKCKLGNNTDYFYKDQLLGERKIISVNGNIEIDRISNFDNEHPEFWGLSLPYGNNLNTIDFYPKNMCNKTARLIITDFVVLLNGSPNNPLPSTEQMTLHFEYIPSIYDQNCPHNAYVDQHGDFPMNFPKDIVLTKQ